MAEPGEAPPPLTPEQLRQINRLSTSARMVAGLAHELNNTLQVVGGLVELLGDRSDIPADALARIAKIGGQAEKATHAVRQVLTYTRDFAPEKGSVSLVPVAETALSLRRYHLGRAGISVTTAFAAGAVVGGEDRTMLQVLLNLLVNAEEALHQQPVRRLQVAIDAGNGLARVAVTDSGHGVPGALHHRIFEPFFTTRSDQHAVGLGLPVARVLAARHGGEVRLADSRPGATTFVVEWPI